jgi:hypothetical protein
VRSFNVATSFQTWRCKTVNWFEEQDYPLQCGHALADVEVWISRQVTGWLGSLQCSHAPVGAELLSRLTTKWG